MRVLIGRGGHAKDIRDAFGYSFDEWWPNQIDVVKWTDKPGEYVIGINDSRTRSEVALFMDGRGWRPGKVGPCCNGCVVMPNVHQGPAVDIGKHTHVNYNAGLTRCRLGDFVTVGPGVTICGDVTVGDRTMIGAGATISNLVNIGSDVTIGAGSVVLYDVPDGQTVYGVPARPALRKEWEDRQRA